MAVRHVMEHTSAQQERVGETLGKLDVEQDDHRREHERVSSDRATAHEALARERASLETVRLELATRKSELATARGEHETRTRDVRASEQESAALEARLASLEELASSRADFSDAARTVLVQANGHVGQQGAVADYLEVDGRYERAVEACLGELLQYVIVDRHDQAAAGLSLVREHDAGRCGFVVVDPGSNGYHPREMLRAPGIVPVSDVMRIQGPHAVTISKVLPEAYVAESFTQAVAFSRETSAVIATLEGDVLRGPHLVTGGTKVESRGILATRREIKELRERVAAGREVLARLSAEAAQLELTMAQATGAIAALQQQEHHHEKAIVAHDAQLARTDDEHLRLERKADVIALERRRAEEERAGLETRRTEAEASIVRLEGEQRQGEERLGFAQRRLADARDAAGALGAQAADARATHAALVERASALEAEVQRLEEGARDLEVRIQARASERQQTDERRAALLASVVESERALDVDIHVLGEKREELRGADEAAAALRSTVEAQDAVIRDARAALEGVRSEAGELELARVTAESDLTHVAQTCIDSVQSSLDDVLAEVEQMELAGETTPDAKAIASEEPDPEAEEEGVTNQVEAQAAPADVPASMTAEEAITRLKEKIDRLGPVNMMAIEQFDELEHASRVSHDAAAGSGRFDRADLTGDRRIDETTKIVHRGVHGDPGQLPGDVLDAVRRRPRWLDAARRERPARKRHRHRRVASGKAAAERACCCRAVRRR
jgi:chromosome segregation protein